MATGPQAKKSLLFVCALSAMAALEVIIIMPMFVKAYVLIVADMHGQ